MGCDPQVAVERASIHQLLWIARQILNYTDRITVAKEVKSPGLTNSDLEARMSLYRRS